jgi:dTDP-D-glucose 4,6-dehydratase
MMRYFVVRPQRAFNPQYDVAAGLREAVEWYRENL